MGSSRKSRNAPRKTAVANSQRDPVMRTSEVTSASIIIFDHADAITSTMRISLRGFMLFVVDSPYTFGLFSFPAGFRIVQRKFRMSPLGLKLGEPAPGSQDDAIGASAQRKA